MSNENDFVAALNRLENLIDSNQAELKRKVESTMIYSINYSNNIIDRKFASLKEEFSKLKSSYSSPGHITDLLALLAEEDNRHNLSDLPERIRAILSTITPNRHVHQQTPDMNASEIGGNVESMNIIDGNVFGTEGHVNGLETNVPTGTTNDGTHLSQSISENEHVNSDSFDPALSSASNAMTNSASGSGSASLSSSANSSDSYTPMTGLTKMNIKHKESKSKASKPKTVELNEPKRSNSMAQRMIDSLVNFKPKSLPDETNSSKSNSLDDSSGRDLSLTTAYSEEKRNF